MFTGLIQAVGYFEKCSLSGDAGKFYVRMNHVFERLELGESIAVNGTCLTLEEENDCLLRFHVMAETFHRTNLGLQKKGSMLNLERAMRADGRFGGHIVSGHVDGTANIISMKKIGSDTEVRLSIPEQAAPYLVEKGSICIDGISLTVADVDAETFAVRIIPTTWTETNLRTRKAGDMVNIEADMIGKYVRAQLESIIAGRTGKKSVTMDDLIKAGF